MSKTQKEKNNNNTLKYTFKAGGLFTLRHEYPVDIPPKEIRACFHENIHVLLKFKSLCLIHFFLDNLHPI